MLSNRALVRIVTDMLRDKRQSITTVESCTGGLLAGVLTSLDGSSSWFDRGFVTYSNQSKHDQVGVKLSLISQYGAVSKEVAEQMALGGLAQSEAELAVSITGVAGPTGGAPEKPVGTVCIAVAGQAMASVVKQFLFEGDRETVREQGVNQALTQIAEYISDQ